ncbi:MAG: EAL domain-containing protein [Actinomycetota bacterium]
MNVRILIAEDEILVRQALAALIDRNSGMELVATASDANEAILLAREHQPDVAILDVKMPGGGGARAAREIAVTSPDTKVLAFSAYNDRATVLEMIKAGATGYLVKGSETQEIIAAIRKVTEGQGAISPSVAHEVLDELAGKLESEDVEISIRRRQEKRIRNAISGGILRSVYQPIVHLASREISGFEALTRFDGYLDRPVYVWFTEAKTLGLGVDLDMAAALTAVEARPRMPASMALTINLAPDTMLSPRFLEDIGTDLRGVVFEVTEHAPVEDYIALEAVLQTLRERGGALAVDDAGAGFASLRHILRLAPEIVKLDIGITQGVHTDPKKKALASALISFASEIGAEIVAEGLEDNADVDTLIGLGASFGQGFLFGHPGPLPTAFVHSLHPLLSKASTPDPLQR